MLYRMPCKARGSLICFQTLCVFHIWLASTGHHSCTRFWPIRSPATMATLPLSVAWSYFTLGRLDNKLHCTLLELTAAFAYGKSRRHLRMHHQVLAQALAVCVRLSAHVCSVLDLRTFFIRRLLLSLHLFVRPLQFWWTNGRRFRPNQV